MSPDRDAPAKRLVINADDLGLTESVNRGIVETIESGVVTSTSFMVNMPGRDDAIRRLRALRARGAMPGVGLHFNIVSGQPLAACDTLVDAHTGTFLPVAVLALKALARRVAEAHVQRELDAQLELAMAAVAPLGIPITHIDSHRHAHCFPAVFDVVTRTAAKRGIAHVRHRYEAGPLMRPRAVVAARLMRALLAKRGPIDDVPFTGFGAMGSRAFDRDIRLLLEALPLGTTELMVHPGYDSPELAAIDAYRAPRERELRALTSPALRARIRELGVELARFGATAPSV